jgi:hypothetical protein
MISAGNELVIDGNPVPINFSKIVTIVLQQDYCETK